MSAFERLLKVGSRLNHQNGNRPTILVALDIVGRTRISRITCAALFMAFLAVVASKGNLSAVSTPPPVDKEQFVGTWVGFTDDGYDFYQLLLHENGKGFCATIITGGPADLYEIKEWKLIQTRVHTNLEKLTEDARDIELTVGPGNYTRNDKMLYVSPKNTSLEMKGRLFRIEHLESRLSQANAMIQKSLKK